MVGARRPALSAAMSSKPKLALLGSIDPFCSVRRFERWARTLRAPSEHHIVYGREVGGSCCGDARCDAEPRRQLVHHFNMFEHIERHLAGWAQRVFGCQLEALAQSDGHVAQVP